MTDLEKFVKLYSDFGIECKVNLIKNEQHIYLSSCGSSEATPTESEKFGGYYYFYSLVKFDLKGKFIGQYFYE